MAVGEFGRPTYADVRSVVNSCITTVVHGVLAGDQESVRLATLALRCYIADVVCDERGLAPEALIDWANLVDLPTS